MFMPARDPPLGDGHVQAEHAMGQEQPDLPTKNKHKNPADHEILQEHGKTSTTMHARLGYATIRHQSLVRTAQHHSLEAEDEQAGSSSL